MQDGNVPNIILVEACNYYSELRQVLSRRMIEFKVTAFAKKSNIIILF